MDGGDFVAAEVQGFDGVADDGEDAVAAGAEGEGGGNCCRVSEGLREWMKD